MAKKKVARKKKTVPRKKVKDVTVSSKPTLPGMEAEKVPRDVMRCAERFMDCKRKKAAANEAFKQAAIHCIESMRKHGIDVLRLKDEDTILRAESETKLKTEKSKEPQDD